MPGSGEDRPAAEPPWYPPLRPAGGLSPQPFLGWRHFRALGPATQDFLDIGQFLVSPGPTFLYNTSLRRRPE